MLQWLYTYVANVCSKCFICLFRRNLQVFYLNVTYVSRICYKCFIWRLHMLAMTFKYFLGVLQVFQMYVASVLSVPDVCCKCFIWMMQKQMSVAHVAMHVRSYIQINTIQDEYACNGFQVFSRCFAIVSNVYFKCFICFGRMLQVFHLDDAKVDRVLHMLQCT